MYSNISFQWAIVKWEKCELWWKWLSSEIHWIHAIKSRIPITIFLLILWCAISTISVALSNCNIRYFSFAFFSHSLLSFQRARIWLKCDIWFLFQFYSTKIQINSEINTPYFRFISSKRDFEPMEEVCIANATGHHRFQYRVYDFGYNKIVEYEWGRTQRQAIVCHHNFDKNSIFFLFLHIQMAIQKSHQTPRTSNRTRIWEKKEWTLSFARWQMIFLTFTETVAIMCGNKIGYFTLINTVFLFSIVFSIISSIKT